MMERSVRILVTGANGQLGGALRAALADHELRLVSRPEFDLLDRATVGTAAIGFRPDLIVHGAAMTDVDGCERDPDLAYRVNAIGTSYVANAATMVGAALLYVSTNYVFDGEQDAPYREYDTPRPISVYGQTKLAGEHIVTSLVPRHYIVRTSWVFGSASRNFFNNIAQWVRDRDEVPVVVDDRGCPTYVRDLAEGIARLVREPAYGTFHLSNEGACNRYDFARAVSELVGGTARLLPMSSAEFEKLYPIPARRPINGAMANVAAAAMGIKLRPWQDALRDFLCAPRS
jgi:dTDP-4-dehydrorhamnose reductase